uniref:Uncharacterized protein n=1 Tax=viral metagenome TaxID=1070528 RepID=A0A6C0DHM7_9ZZZZ
MSYENIKNPDPTNDVNNDANKIIESFNEYYKLKNTYEVKFNKEKQKLIKDKSLSWREKRSEYKKLKPQCINCKRPVGTIFSIKRTSNENEDFRELQAICGSITEPCNLNININTGVSYNLLDHIKELEKDSNEYKNDIIKDKNKLLFGYITPEKAIGRFDKLKESINDINFLLNLNYETLFQIIDNKKDTETIQKLKETVYILIQEIKEGIKNYNSTNDVQYVRDCVEIYINQIQPKLKDIMLLKYKNNFVEYDDNANVYKLIQQKYSIFDLEEIYTQPAVISFEYGNVTKTKASKKKQITTELPKEEEVLNVPIVLPLSIRPRIQQDGTVTWDNDEYQKIWNKLPVKYRDAISKDREWLQETMDTLTENKKQNKLLKFINPSNLIVPPQILDDGSYDFGNEIYNNIFNGLEKSYQQTLLTLYTEQNGVKNYNMLLETLANIIAKELDATNLY